MITCSHCAKKFIPKSVGLNLCPFCGYAQGEGVPPVVVEAFEETPRSGSLLIRTMGRLALLMLLLLFGALLFLGYTSQQESVVSETPAVHP